MGVALVSSHITINKTPIPRIGVNTRRVQGANCKKSLLDALASGVRCIDTAQSYKNEIEIGQAIQESGLDRDELIVITKVHISDYRPYDLLWSVRESLDRLRLDHVDLLLLDGINPEVGLARTVETLEEARDRQMTREIGAANFSLSSFEDLNRTASKPIKVLETEYHPFINRDEELEKIRQMEGVLLACAPLAMGAVNMEPGLIKLARKYERTPAQIALRWLVQQDRVCMLPRARSTDEMASLTDVFDFQLSDEDVHQINDLREQNLRFFSDN